MIEIKNLSKTFISKDVKTEALDKVSLNINDGDIYGIIGMSGAGKSTLVRCINMLERPDSGEVIIDGCNLSDLKEADLRKFRRKVAMIFQGFNLLMQVNCLKNVMFPLELAGVDSKKAFKRALELLEIVGLKDKANAYPSMLSGGQQQRVAIARALASDPEILLCDEATSALDPNTTDQILELIRDINKKFNITVIIITHQMSVVENICNKVAILDNGKVVEEGSVTDVFSHPKSLTAKKLVFPEMEYSKEVIRNNNEEILRVVFNGSDTTGKPLISSLAIEKGIAINIIYASIKEINNKTYGSMLIGVKNREQLEEACAYLTKNDGVSAGEFDIYV